jgi:hypothetical protein
VDERSLALVQVSDRLKFKAQLLVSVLEELYANVAGFNLEQAHFAFRGCQLLVEVARQVEVLQAGIARVDPHNFHFAVSYFCSSTLLLFPR